MKRMIALALSLVMSLCLFAGCSSAETTDTTTAPATEGTTAPATESVPETTAASAAFTTVEEGKLIMATNAFFPPYEYYEGETIVGIDAEIAAAIAEKLGLELVIQNMEFNSIITAVTTGAADFGLAGMTVT